MIQTLSATVSCPSLLYIVTYTGTLRGDKLLKEDQLFSEVISVVLAEPDIEGIGLFFDTDQFKTLKTDRAADGSSSSIPLTKQLFAPYAYNLGMSNPLLVSSLSLIIAANTISMVLQLTKRRREMTTLLWIVPASARLILTQNGSKI